MWRNRTRGARPVAARRKPAEDRKAEIVAAAIALAAERGPDQVSAQALAQAVGVSQPAIFRHFPTMAEVWQGVGERITAAMREDKMQAPEGEALAALMQAVARNLKHIVANPAIPTILFSRELHARNETLRRLFEEVMRHRRQGYARLIARAQAEGAMTGEAEAEDLAALILAVIQGLAMRWSLENRDFDLSEEGQRLIRVMLGLR